MGTANAIWPRDPLIQVRCSTFQARGHPGNIINDCIIYTCNSPGRKREHCCGFLRHFATWHPVASGVTFPAFRGCGFIVVRPPRGRSGGAATASSHLPGALQVRERTMAVRERGWVDLLRRIAGFSFGISGFSAPARCRFMSANRQRKSRAWVLWYSGRRAHALRVIRPS